MLLLLLLPAIRIASCVLSARPMPNKEQQAALRMSGDKIVAAIEDWSARNGRYPETLEQAGITIAPTKNGSWGYSLRTDGKSFQLSMGEYDVDGWVLYWDSREHEWGLDT